jgi:hypothetical protein
VRGLYGLFSTTMMGLQLSFFHSLMIFPPAGC